MLLVNDLGRHNQSVMPELKKAVLSVVESGWYILGNQVKLFEQEYAEFCQTAHCISVGNGTDALELALRALEIKPKDIVMTVANAGGYSTTAILNVGAIPYYIEIDADTSQMSTENLQQALEQMKPQAVIVTHLYGGAAPLEPILSMLNTYGIPVIEDCAQAQGAHINGRKVGAIGTIGCFSFYPSKNLGALGDGGAVVTNSTVLAKRLRLLSQYGWENKYEATLKGGFNSRLDEIQAAILRVKLPYLQQWNKRRLEISLQYVEGINHPAIKLPTFDVKSFVGHLFVLQTAKRDELRAYLKSHDIMSDVHYPIPDYRQPFLQKVFAGLSLPITEKVAAESLTLPCFPEMTEEEILKVINCVNGWPET